MSKAANAISGNGVSTDLSSIMGKFLSEMTDVRSLILSTVDGGELFVQHRAVSALASQSTATTYTSNNNIDVTDAESSHIVSSLAPSFAISIDQSSRLNLGQPKYSITWVGNNYIILQTMIESIILSLVLYDNANIGIVEEQLSYIECILKPLLQS